MVAQTTSANGGLHPRVVDPSARSTLPWRPAPNSGVLRARSAVSGGGCRRPDGSMVAALAPAAALDASRFVAGATSPSAQRRTGEVSWGDGPVPSQRGLLHACPRMRTRRRRTATFPSGPRCLRRPPTCWIYFAWGWASLSGTRARNHTATSRLIASMLTMESSPYAALA